MTDSAWLRMVAGAFIFQLDKMRQKDFLFPAAEKH